MKCIILLLITLLILMNSSIAFAEIDNTSASYAVNFDFLDNNKTIQKQAFEYTGWGYFNEIEIRGEPYFASYVRDEDMPADDQVLYLKSGDECSICKGQLQKILMNSNEKLVVEDRIVKLKEGYELFIRSVNDKGQSLVELRKNKKIIDTSIIAPWADGATMLDKTYYYKTDVDDQEDLVIIAIHFYHSYENEDENLRVAIIDGIWQISDTAKKSGNSNWIDVNYSRPEEPLRKEIPILELVKIT